MSKLGNDNETVGALLAVVIQKIVRGEHTG
jgi:hypothetical protein